MTREQLQEAISLDQDIRGYEALIRNLQSEEMVFDKYNIYFKEVQQFAIRIANEDLSILKRKFEAIK